MNICTRRGIGLHEVERKADGSARARISRRDFARLRPVAYKTRTRVHIIEKRGMRELRRSHGRRYGLMLGAVLCVVFIFIAPRFIWSVSIEGNESVPRERIEEVLREAGIYRGVWKGSVPDGFTVKDILLRSEPELMWAWAYVRGTTVTVKVAETNLPPLLVDRRSPCSICASCDAYIKTVRALNGQRLVNSGDVVRAGDVLVSGREAVFKEGYPEKYLYVHARAEVEAYTMRSESGVYKLEREIRTPAGRAERKAYIELFGRRINLYRNPESSFAEYDTAEFRHDLPFIAFGGMTYTEVASETEPLSLDGAIGIAREELEERIAKKLCKNAVMLDEETDWEYVSDDEIRVRVTMSCIEDIGAEVPLDVGVSK